jgi:hypothetical protein
MPYIEESKRDKFNDLIFLSGRIYDVGELNYVITKILMRYQATHGERYSTYNDMIGVLECVKQELYRRKILIYENQKMDENGDVYE